MKKLLFSFSFFVMLFICGCHDANSNQMTDIEQWVSYDDIVIGSTTLETVEALHGKSSDKDVIAESVEFVCYEGYHLIVEDGQVKTIVIENNTAPLLWNKISVGSSLDMLLSILPVTPMKLEYDMASPPPDLPEKTDEPYAILATAFEENTSKVAEKQLVFAISPKYTITFQIDTEQDTITEISLHST